MTSTSHKEQDADAIAVIGLAGRFPGAPTIEAFWENLRHGVESVRFFTDDELEAAGVPENVRRAPDYVPAKPVLDDIAGFDAGYFGMSPREAALVDPQQRLFLEVCSELLERAAIGPGALRERMAVFGGVSKNTYLVFNLLTHPELLRSPAALQVLGANDKDYLATRVSYKLGLRGPSLTVQTACSSSLVALHLARQSLLSGESDYAIVGGVAVDVPHHAGYVYEPGGIYSPDGHCRTFDADARGTIFGEGAGAVLLRRLGDAVEAGDDVHAVILGSALNNDGGEKIGFSAPSVEGQATVVVEALVDADVDPSTISYLEAHGTGTSLGDPIEVEALTRAYKLWTDRTGFCRIGSVKTNIGHLNAASGIAGLIKTVLALRHRQIPPSLHFNRPNPQLALERTPFQVATELTPWQSTDGQPLRAGVSSFGIGGTNAHVIVEEAPPRAPSTPTTSWQLIPLSARTAAALGSMSRRLGTAVEAGDHLELADVAHTCQEGRERFAFRRAVVARDRAGASRQLDAPAAVPAPTSAPSVVFLFPGQGVQYPGLASGLYAEEPTFRAELDECAEILRDLGASDPRELAALDVRRTELAQPLLFCVEYALARLLQSWGIQPAALAGHSLGEVTAAAVAGMLARDDALRLVAERARLMAAAPPGAMLAVACPAAELPVPLPPGVEIAAVNSSTQLVLSGPAEAVGRARDLLTGKGIGCQPVSDLHAFHSAAMDDASQALTEFAAGLPSYRPGVPVVSNLTGTWFSEHESAYWGRQLRGTVRFADGAGELLAEPNRVFVEVGPGKTLGRLIARHPSWSRSGHRTVSVLPDRPGTEVSDLEAVLQAVGRLWELGIEADWPKLHSGARRLPVVLPTYPFERRRHWIDAAGAVADERSASAPAAVVAGSGPEFEERVTAVFGSLLGVEHVASEDDFFELGGHSLLGVELVTRLRDATGIELPLSAIFDQPTPGAIAELIRAAHDQGVEEALAGVGVSAADDIELPELSIPASGPHHGEPRTVLLTGGTGFLGAFLLSALLRQTTATIECVVRCSEPAAGLARLTAGLKRYQLLAGADLSRVKAVPGDLSKPGLGLADADYERLARGVDTIYHNGAKVSFLEPYRLIRRTNVTAVREILRFACRHTLKPVHHVSTIAVFDCDNFAGLTVAGEDEDLAAAGGFHGGYDESKWVAERILALARERGVPVTVFRPGNIAGDSRTGAVSDGHLVSAMIKGCVALGLAPDIDAFVDVVPVDYVSRALVHLSLRESVRGQNFNLVNPTPVRWPDVAGQLSELGYPLKLVSLAEWREAIRAVEGTGNSMRVFLPMLDERALFSGRRYRCERTLAELERSDISCPPLDRVLIERYVQALVDIGELPSPGAS